jgi:hypothetical protein
MQRKLNSDGQLFHQFQQNEHKKRPGHMSLEIHVQKNVEGVKPVNVIPTRPLLIIGSPMYKPNTKMNDKDHILTQK